VDDVLQARFEAFTAEQARLNAARMERVIADARARGAASLDRTRCDLGGTVPESLGGVTTLTELYLCNNELTTLPDALGNLTALTCLDPSSNRSGRSGPDPGRVTNGHGLGLLLRAAVLEAVMPAQPRTGAIAATATSTASTRSPSSA